MLHHRKAPSTKLEEDLQSLGIAGDPSDIHGLATMTVEDAVVGIGLKGHGGDGGEDGGQITEDADGNEPGDGGEQVAEGAESDPIDGKFVTRELLSRIVNLPMDTMEEADFDEILEGLKTKDLPEDDEELANLAEAVVEQLVEGKLQKIRQAKGGFKRKAKAGFQMKGGKIKRIATGERITKRRERKKYMRGKGKVLAKRWQRTVGKRHGKRLAHRKPLSASTLALDLGSLMAESRHGETFAPAVERLARIFNLLDEQIADADVCRIMEETWNSFEDSITEDTTEDSFMESIRPCLMLVKRCLEHIEKQDQEEEYSEGGKEKPKGGKGKGKKTVEKVSGQDAGTGHSHEDTDDDELDDDEGDEDPT